jgi:putative restriction endonuclease
MRMFVGITDSDWFEMLAELRPDEVSFWLPSGSVGFQALNPGELFLFKLHSPNDFVVGGGVYSQFTTLPASFAWKAFEQKNGANSETEMRRRIEKYRRTNDPATDYTIGCVILTQPFFFAREQWIPIRGWHRSIVRGKTYTSDEEDGRYLWSSVQESLQATSFRDVAIAAAEAAQRYGQPQLIAPRLGQGAFRVSVTEAYRRQCAFTGSHVLHVLEAAHIKPYAIGGEHRPANGLLLRQDVHTLFDRGYLTVTPEYRVEVSGRIKDEFDNGKEYYLMHGRQIWSPEHPRLQPDREALRWHNERVFRQ